jgi:hypothetical protein
VVEGDGWKETRAQEEALPLAGPTAAACASPPHDG